MLFVYLSSVMFFFIFYLVNGWDFVEIFKMYFLLEIMRILCGGFVILFIILSLFLFFFLFKKIKKEGENRWM